MQANRWRGLRLLTFCYLCLGAGLTAAEGFTKPGAIQASQTGVSKLWQNPAHIPSNDSDEPVWIGVGNGGYFNDRNQLLDAFDELQAESRRLEETSSQRPLLPSDVEPLIAALQAVDGRILTGSGGASFALSLPLTVLDLVLFSSASGRMATTFDYDPEDANTLRSATLIGAFTATDLESRIIATGVITTDIGVTAAKTVPEFYGARLGVTLKHQVISLFDRSIEIDEYEEGDLRDRHRNISTDRFTNIDVGVSKQWQRWSAGIAVANLIQEDARSPTGRKYHQQAGVRVDVGYQADRWAVSMSWDPIATQQGFGFLEDERRVSTQFQWQWSPDLSLNAGFHKVVEGRDDDAISLGAGWQISKRWSTKLAYLYAGAREQGGAFQIDYRWQ